MEKNKEDSPVEVFSGINWEAEMVKNILENEGIEAFITNEIIGSIAPFFTNQGKGSVKVVVSNLNYNKARLIVSEFEKNREE